MSLKAILVQSVLLLTIALSGSLQAHAKCGWPISQGEVDSYEPLTRFSTIDIKGNRGQGGI